jgi:hypothetical protein
MAGSKSVSLTSPQNGINFSISGLVLCPREVYENQGKDRRGAAAS